MFTLCIECLPFTLIFLSERRFHATVDHTESALAETRDGLHPRLKHGPFGKTMTTKRAHPSTCAIKVGCDRPAITPRTGSVPLHPGTDLREPQPSETVQSLPRCSHKMDCCSPHWTSCCATRGNLTDRTLRQGPSRKMADVGLRHSNHDSEPETFI